MNARRTRALTLVEVLVATVMLAVISASVVALFPAIVSMNRESTVDQSVTAASKLFFEGLSAVRDPTDLIPGTYPAGTLVGGSGVRVPSGCSAAVTEPIAQVRSVALECPDAPRQILQLASVS